MANNLQSSSNGCSLSVDTWIGANRRWKLVQVPVSASLRVLFLLQESAASRLLQMVWKGRPRFLQDCIFSRSAFRSAFSFVQQGGWCVATALNQRDSGSHLIPFEVIFQMKTGPFKPKFWEAWEPQTWLKSTSHLSHFTRPAS